MGRPVTGSVMRGCSALARGGPRGIEALLRADQPLLAAARERLAPLPERDGLLERRAALLELGDHAHELVARLLVRQRVDAIGRGRGGGAGGSGSGGRGHISHGRSVSLSTG